jgi:hypothetical protein
MSRDRLAQLPGNVRPRRGYLAPCPRCGDVVVHGFWSSKPSPSHLAGRPCAERAAERERLATPSSQPEGGPRG